MILQKLKGLIENHLQMPHLVPNCPEGYWRNWEDYLPNHQDFPLGIQAGTHTFRKKIRKRL